MRYYKVLIIAITIFTINSLSGFSIAAAEAPISNNKAEGISNISYSISPQSYDSSFTLDFSQSTAWTLDFDNNSTLVFNHKKVTIKYLSNYPSNANASVRVELYIDEDEDGTYEKYDPNGGYLYSLNKGDSLEIKLPYGNTVKNYRLYFENRTSSVTSATFSVKTS
ncbi:MAG: hypothetical protein K0S01_111 [Herbinix sp.]|jgi:hypothetical protein|nr:hypothetical protein [Herbinix sp.]